jgi:hypothetical protein
VIALACIAAIAPAATISTTDSAIMPAADPHDASTGARAAADLIALAPAAPGPITALPYVAPAMPAAGAPMPEGPSPATPTAIPSAAAASNAGPAAAPIAARSQRFRLVSLNLAWDAVAEFDLNPAPVDLSCVAMLAPLQPERLSRAELKAMLLNHALEGQPDGRVGGAADVVAPRSRAPDLSSVHAPAAPAADLRAAGDRGVIGLFAAPISNLYVGLAWYDSATDDGVASHRRGPKTWRDAELSDEHMVIGEAGIQWSLPGDGDAGSGRIAAGGWYHAEEFDRHYLGEDEHVGGYYLMFEQQLWRPTARLDEPRGMSLFVQVGRVEDLLADPDPQERIGAGLAWRGAVAGRDADAAGISLWLEQPPIFGAAAVRAGSEDDRAAVELFYRIQVTPAFSLRPDLQFILDDLGAPANDGLGTDIVAAIRAQIAF